MSTPTHPPTPPVLQFVAMVFVAVATLVPVSWLVWKGHRRIWFEPVVVEKSEFVVRRAGGNNASIEGKFVYSLGGLSRESERFTEFGPFVSKVVADRVLAEVAPTVTAYRSPWSGIAIRSDRFWHQDSFILGMATCFGSFGLVCLMMILDRMIARVFSIPRHLVTQGSGSGGDGVAREPAHRVTWPENPFVMSKWIGGFLALFPIGFVIMVTSFYARSSGTPEVLMAVHRVVVAATFVAMVVAVVQGVVRARRWARKRMEGE